MRPLLLALLILLPSCTTNTPPATPPPAPLVTANAGVVASVRAEASEVGRDVLARGGNAVDAAVATAFALAATFPEAGNIGGGGFMLIHFPDAREPVVVDYREKAPASATPDMYRDKAARTPHRLVGVPGTVRGLALARDKYGKLPWRDLVLPAVQLARDGFVLNKDGAASLNRVLTNFADRATLQRTFRKPDGTPWSAGDRLVQPELAATLQILADAGPDAFYTGPIADQIVAEMQSGQGLITKADLAAYTPELRAPIHGTFRGHDVYAPPPPSSGGIALVEMLNILEYFPLHQMPRDASRTIHLITEAMRRAYADRAKFVGDPAFADVPPYLTSKEYALKLAKGIDTSRATPSASLAGDIPLRDEPENTTHFSVVDAAGMAVSNTYTLENSYGGKIVVGGAGFLLNDELGDFNPQPGVTTRSGQVGTPANLPAPGKRPLSSMTPTIVAKDGQVLLITGSTGGRTIINTVLCVLLNRIEFNLSPRDSVDALRHHHQWFPDRITLEPPPAAARDRVVAGLRALGHTVNPQFQRQGDAHSIFYDQRTKRWTGVADQRREGAAAGVTTNNN